MSHLHKAVSFPNGMALIFEGVPSPLHLEVGLRRVSCACLSKFLKGPLHSWLRFNDEDGLQGSLVGLLP